MIIIKFHPNVNLSEIMNRTHDSAMQTQGHSLRSWDLPLYMYVVSVSALYLLNPLNGLLNIKLHSNVPLCELVCTTQDIKVKVMEFCGGDMAVLQTAVLLKQDISGFGMERVNLYAM